MNENYHCYRCDPKLWLKNRGFFVQYTIGMADRQGAEFTRTFMFPKASKTMRAALQEAIAALPQTLADVVDRALITEICKQAAFLWEEACSSADSLSEYGWREPADLMGLNPTFVLRVPTILTNQSAATVAMHCFPISFANLSE
jgi:hypothetical protein